MPGTSARCLHHGILMAKSYWCMFYLSIIPLQSQCFKGMLIVPAAPWWPSHPLCRAMKTWLEGEKGMFLPLLLPMIVLIFNHMAWKSPWSLYEAMWIFPLFHTFRWWNLPAVGKKPKKMRTTPTISPGFWSNSSSTGCCSSSTGQPDGVFLVS